MKHNIGHWMKRNVVSIKPNATLLKAAQLLAEKKVGTLPVVDANGSLVGVTTLRGVLQYFMPDFIKLIEDIDFVHDFGALEMPMQEDILSASEITVQEMMAPPISIEVDCKLMRAVSLFSKHDVIDLPVVDSENKLVGIVSRVDVGRAFIEAWLNKMPKKSQG